MPAQLPPKAKLVLRELIARRRARFATCFLRNKTVYVMWKRQADRENCHIDISMTSI